MLKSIPAAMMIETAKDVLAKDTEACTDFTLKDCQKELHVAGVEWANDAEKVKAYVFGLQVAQVEQSWGMKI